MIWIIRGQFCYVSSNIYMQKFSWKIYTKNWTFLSCFIACLQNMISNEKQYILRQKPSLKPGILTSFLQKHHSQLNIYSFQFGHITGKGFFLAPEGATWITTVAFIYTAFMQAKTGVRDIERFTRKDLPALHFLTEGTAQKAGRIWGSHSESFQNWRVRTCIADHVKICEQ